MKRCNKILSNRRYRFYLQKNSEHEAGRAFCHHHFEHLVAVARLTYLLLLEDGYPFISREIAYAAGLLHDIGRWKEYRTGEDHAAISARLAEPILKAAGFSSSERLLIEKAIAQHRQKDSQNVHRSPLSKMLGKADRLARLCFLCDARHGCNKLNRQPHQRRFLY